MQSFVIECCASKRDSYGKHQKQQWYFWRTQEPQKCTFHKPPQYNILREKNVLCIHYVCFFFSGMSVVAFGNNPTVHGTRYSYYTMNIT